MTRVLVVGDGASGSIVRSRLKAIGAVLVAGLGSLHVASIVEATPVWDLLEDVFRRATFMLWDWWAPPLPSYQTLPAELEQRVLKGHI